MCFHDPACHHRRLHANVGITRRAGEQGQAATVKQLSNTIEEKLKQSGSLSQCMTRISSSEGYFSSFSAGAPIFSTLLGVFKSLTQGHVVIPAVEHVTGGVFETLFHSPFYRA